MIFKLFVAVAILFAAQANAMEKATIGVHARIDNSMLCTDEQGCLDEQGNMVEETTFAFCDEGGCTDEQGQVLHTWED